METLTNVLQWINDAVIDEYLAQPHSEMPPTQHPFEPSKTLRERDEMIVSLLNSSGHEDVSFCVCDPEHKDCPIVFASDGFCKVTGYSADEVEGRNCRFLQGTDTKIEDVKKIREAIKQEEEASINIRNYKKDGTAFNNQFFLMPMYDDSDKLQYFIGIQCSVEKFGPGQRPKNVGWVYTQGLHI